MPNKTRIALLLVLVTVPSVSAVWAGNKKHDKKKNTGTASAVPTMDGRQRAEHALNRLTFGPRPGDVDRVMAMGVDKWIDQQLHPEKIDDTALTAKLASFRTLNMSPQQMVMAFPSPQLIKAVENGRISMPSDPTERAIYQAQMDRIDQKKDQTQQAADQQQPEDDNSMTDEQKAARRQARQQAEQKYEELMAMPADQRMNAILKMTPDAQSALARNLKPANREQLMQSLSPQQREELLAMRNPGAVVVTELQQAKILRAVYSDRQLEEVMTDFWFNHFNVFINKGADRYLTTAYERDVIRPHALGKFKDLLVATAKSPAMLWYLDNWDSVGANSEFARNGGERPQNRPFAHGRFGHPINPRVQQARQQQAKRAPKGLNENYARELMELHTLGVDGGYSQQDVTEVAKVFTGWTIDKPLRGAEYKFDEQRHEPGPKFVLGQNIKENGEKEGMQVLDLLSRSPATAHFISKKLAMRFVSDDPPQPLVDSMSDTFLKTDGDIREVLRTMFQSPEFWAPDAYRAKVKTPFEFVVSSIRATDADVTNAMPLVATLNKMGEPLYQQQPPTGYSMKADAWVNSAALLNRMNFSLALASGRFPGSNFDPQRILGTTSVTTPDQAVGNLENALLAGEVSKQTHETILKQLSDPQVTGRVLDDPARPARVGIVAGLILGSPEFQRR